MNIIYDVCDIAEYVIEQYNTMNVVISNLKLQKVLYFIQAEFLVAKNYPCFNEAIEAWDIGPVVPKVYFKYRMYGSCGIPYCISCYKCSYGEKINIEDKKLIDGIIDECSKYSAAVLTELTHNQTPWIAAYIPKLRRIISKESIKQYFSC